MSKLLTDLYMQHRQNKAFLNALQHQEYMRDWYERRRAEEAQAELQQRENLRNAQIHARETFYSNLHTRRLDLQHSISLYPMSYCLMSDWLRYCGSQVLIGKIEGAALSTHALTNTVGSTLFDPRFIAYDNIGSMCNDKNPHLQIQAQIAVALFFREFKSEYCTDQLQTVKLTRSSKIAHFVLGFTSAFAAIGERSSATPFMMYWGLPEACKTQLRKVPGLEATLFDVFCPKDISLADDLIRMREIFSLSRYSLNDQPGLDIGKPLASGIAGFSATATVDKLIEEQYTAKDIQLISDGIKALIATGDLVDVSSHTAVISLHERFPLIYVLVLTLLLLERINAAAFNELSECLGDVDKLIAKIPSSYVRAALGLERYFPELASKENYELISAMLASNLTIDDADISKAKDGFIIPRDNCFPTYHSYYQQFYAARNLPAGGDLEPFFEPVFSVVSDEFYDLVDSTQTKSHVGMAFGQYLEK